MPTVLVNPLDESHPRTVPAPPRLDTLRGKTVGLLDISKPGGSIFLDRIQRLLEERHGVRRVLRERKPTFARPAADGVLDKLRSADAVIEALAD
jgi:hypothetical protein